MIDTIKQAFLGKKELFQGLYLENNWDWNISYPVIHIDFSALDSNDISELKMSIINILVNIAKFYGIELPKTMVANTFKELIYELNNKYNQQVVILVDEYDKPILDNILNQELCQNIREVLDNLYSVIKSCDSYIKFVLLTGVSNFNRVSVFSGLNNLNDISLHYKYADICGYTQYDIDNLFKEYLINGNVDSVKLKYWYNGYNFAGNDQQKVYNPFDIMLFFDSGYIYDSYWFSTGAPKFLIDLLDLFHNLNFYLKIINSSN